MTVHRIHLPGRGTSARRPSRSVMKRRTGLSGLGRKLMPCVAGLSLGAGLLVAPGVAHADTEASHFIWTVTSASQVGAVTEINNGATNGDPNAILFVTQNWSPGGVCGCVTDTSPIGVYYDTGTDEWTIFNEAGGAVPVGAQFNVLAFPAATADAFSVTADSSNTDGGVVYFSNSATNNNPKAIIQATQVDTGVVNYNNIVAFYAADGDDSFWGISNEGGLDMPLGATFNVLIGSQAGGKAAVLRATGSNTGGDSTHLNNPVTNGNSNNFTLETQVFNPGDVLGRYDQSTTAVWYLSSDGQEVVFNENNDNMLKKTDFNVLVWNS